MKLKELRLREGSSPAQEQLVVKALPHPILHYVNEEGWALVPFTF